MDDLQPSTTLPSSSSQQPPAPYSYYNPYIFPILAHPFAFSSSGYQPTGSGPLPVMPANQCTRCVELQKVIDEAKGTLQMTATGTEVMARATSLLSQFLKENNTAVGKDTEIQRMSRLLETSIMDARKQKDVNEEQQKTINSFMQELHTLRRSHYEQFQRLKFFDTVNKQLNAEKCKLEANLKMKDSNSVLDEHEKTIRNLKEKIQLSEELYKREQDTWFSEKQQSSKLIIQLKSKIAESSDFCESQERSMSDYKDARDSYAAQLDEAKKSEAELKEDLKVSQTEVHNLGKILAAAEKKNANLCAEIKKVNEENRQLIKALEDKNSSIPHLKKQQPPILKPTSFIKKKTKRESDERGETSKPEKVKKIE